MTAGRPLAGLGVVLTRPRAQCEAIAHALESAGARVLVFPALDIVPIALSAESRAALASLPSASLAIFVSANAAEHGVALARAAGPWPEAAAAAGVGAATAAALREAGFARVIAPETGFDSESLLACPAFNDVKGKRILVFRGGRIVESFEERPFEKTSVLAAMVGSDHVAELAAGATP